MKKKLVIIEMYVWQFGRMIDLEMDRETVCVCVCKIGKNRITAWFRTKVSTI